jgi:hypothetical protein
MHYITHIKYHTYLSPNHKKINIIIIITFNYISSLVKKTMTIISILVECIILLDNYYPLSFAKCYFNIIS